MKIKELLEKVKNVDPEMEIRFIDTEFSCYNDVFEVGVKKLYSGEWGFVDSPKRKKDFQGEYFCLE